MIPSVEIDVPGRGPVPVFNDHERAAIERAIVGFYGRLPDPATVQIIIQHLAEIRILGIGIEKVLNGDSRVGYSEAEGLVFQGPSPALTAPPC